MKHSLFESITVIPYTSGEAIDREGFRSAILAANVASGAEVTVKVEHSDDGETFVPVTDELVFPEAKTENGEYTFKNEPIETEDGEDADGVVNIDIDLIGLKNIVMFTVTGADNLAVVLGDGTAQPT